ncbi:MAG: hypothetical protein QOE31_343 [Solirubrobacteraceae bacterium]|nr:hypothetical protein [Solirubrobacteraceae bacterium]
MAPRATARPARGLDAGGFHDAPGGRAAREKLASLAPTPDTARCTPASLIQTRKIRSFPVILVGTTYWSGLVDWLRESALQEGKIDAADIDRMPVTDDLDWVVERVVRAAAEQRG